MRLTAFILSPTFISNNTPSVPSFRLLADMPFGWIADSVTEEDDGAFEPATIGFDILSEQLEDGRIVELLAVVG